MPTKRPAKSSSVDLELQVQDYLQNRSMRERSSGRENKLKAEFMKLLTKAGVLQSGGHRVIMLTEPLPYVEYKNGKTKQRTITGIRRMRRGSTTLNAERAMAFLKRKKMLEECTVTEVAINEDAILAAAFEGKITDPELKALYDEAESFAFYLVDDTDTPDADEE